VIEVHVTLSRSMFGPDVPASVTPEELRSLVDGIALIESSLTHPLDKDAVAADLHETKLIFGRSVAPTQALPAGTTLEAHHLTLKKPGTGIQPERLAELVGRTLQRDVAADELLDEGDLA
jgi:N-acetylneuraminate synthase